MSTKQLAAALPTVQPPRWLWLWFPLSLFTLFLLLALRDDSDPTFQRRWWIDYFMFTGWRSSTWEEESGFIELVTPLFSTLAVIAGIAALLHRARLPTGWIRWWVALITLACIYITGEELAWGQYLFDWPAPERWPSPETNLHSISETDPADYWWASWFNEKPRLLLELFVLGGIIHVFMQRGAKRGDWRDWFWPTYVCLPIAIFAILARIPERMDWIGLGYAHLLFEPNVIYWQSFQELFFSWFLAVYLLSIWYRVTDGTDRASTDTSGSKQRGTVTIGRRHRGTTK